MRLIDAERLSAEIFKASMDEHFMPMKLLDCDTITEIIGNAPTIEEHKTGKWIFGETMGHSWMKCSECCKSQDGQTLCFTYCPNCGAKMEVAE